ncbi:partial RNA polymerase sigma factor RpoD, partial [Rhodocyclaceae bacterium]
MAKEKAKAAAKSAGKKSKAGPRAAARTAARPAKVVKKAVKAAPAKARPAPAKVKAKAQARPVPVKTAAAKPRKEAAPPVPAAPVAAKEAPPPKLKVGRGKGRAALAPAPLAQPLDLETRRTRLKNLIALGKERGFLTYAEVNDHLPDDMVDAEQIESIISTFNDMGIQVFDEAPAAEDLLMTEGTPPAVADEDIEEEAEQALSTVESEFGRTTDPVRMYMREMGSVELLTREGEIEIAKRIEDGLKHMVQAISACPTTIAEMLDMAARVARDEMRVDELVDGLIDPNAAEDIEALAENEELAVEEDEADEEDEGGAVSASLLQLKADALERFTTIHGIFVKMQNVLVKKGPREK